VEMELGTARRWVSFEDGREGRMLLLMWYLSVYVGRSGVVLSASYQLASLFTSEREREDVLEG
jgi:hypothetical protein